MDANNNHHREVSPPSTRRIGNEHEDGKKQGGLGKFLLIVAGLAVLFAILALIGLAWNVEQKPRA